MKEYKQEFIEFLAKTGALELKERQLKSGRISPYFVNIGGFNDGESISKLGNFYASALMNNFDVYSYNVLFGPAYKGIPLVDATAIALWQDRRARRNVSYNRKEAKTHGDAGLLLGYQIKNGDRVLIVDDVFTTGDTKTEMLEIIRSIAPDVKFVGLQISVDRMEVDKNEENAIKKFEEKEKIPVKSIVTIEEIVEHLHNKDIEGKIYINDAIRGKIEDYLKKYGVRHHG